MEVFWLSNYFTWISIGTHDLVRFLPLLDTFLYHLYSFIFYRRYERSQPLWNCFALLLNFHFFQSFIQPSHSSEEGKQIALLFNFHFFIPPHPNQIKFWDNFAFMFYSHFSNHSSHPIPPATKNINHSEYAKTIWGWLVGDWDGKQWDWSHPCLLPEWPSHPDPTKWNIRTCSTKLPSLEIMIWYLVFGILHWRHL